MLYSKLFLALLFSINLYANSLAIIVSKNSSITNISKKELSKIFLAKTKRFPNGQRAITIENTNEEYQSKFYKTVCKKNEKQIKKYWAKMIFTGRGQPPKKINSIKEIKLFVNKNRNAISYIPLEHLDDKVKMIMRID